MTKLSRTMKSPIETYKLFSEFYDLYVGNFNADFDFYKTYCHNSYNILEIGCGTGRILNLLLQNNSNVTGIDISQEMLDRAAAKFKTHIENGQLKLVNHNFLTDQLSLSFNKILLSFYTFNYILDNPAIFFKNVHNSLSKKGLLLMDLFYPNSLFDKSINGKWIDKEYNIDGNDIKIRDYRTMVDDTELRQQIFIINNKETKIDTKRKYYSPSFLKEKLELVGFKNIAFSYGYDYHAFSEMIDEEKLENNYIVKAEKAYM